MDILSSDQVRQLLLFIPPFILSLSFHEYAHAWVADKYGDSTARYLGRLTMDPMAHISWMGTVIIPAFAVLTGAPLFGWANPVPVDARNFRKPRAHMAVVAAAGPISNFLVATVCTALLAVLIHKAGVSVTSRRFIGGLIGPAIEMLVMAVQLNLFLAFFNLIPIPPLDGSRVVQGFMGHRMAEKFDTWSQYGSWMLLILFFTGGLRVISYPVYMFMSFLFSAFGIS